MRKSKKIKVAVELLIVALLIYSFIEPLWIQVKVMEEYNPNIPKAFNNTKIVFVSDIHCDLLHGKSRIRGLVNRINNLHPDIIILGGDFINDEDYIKPCFAELKGLKANMDKYAVLGNHDNTANKKMVTQYINEAGIKLLDNAAEWVYKNGERIKIGGVGDYWTDNQDINPTIIDTTKDDCVWLVSHNPEFADGIKTHRIDMVLSGHTHGGQFTVFGLWGPSVKSYRTGIVKTEYTKVLVSNGIGSFFQFPIRLFARPQINVIQLKSASL